LTPFAGEGAFGVCIAEAVNCREDPADHTIRLGFTLPAGYEAAAHAHPLIWGPGGKTGLVLLRGGNLYSDPCHSTPPPDIAVGPTADDFANSLRAHRHLNATAPVDATLAGYAGKYVDLEMPSDIVRCSDGQIYPWEPGLYAQGPNQRWHLWILDVQGVRVVIQSMDYASTPRKQQAELNAIVDSITIER
jgi:hypothetical protein